MEQISLWLRTHRWMALSGFFVLVTFYLMVAAVIPRASDAVARFKGWQHQQERLASVAGWEIEKAQISIQQRRLHQRFEDLYVNLPKSEQMSTILQEVQAGADETGVTLQQVRPANLIAYANYDDLPFLVELKGPFHAVATFINRLEQSQYLIKVHGLRLTAEAPALGTLHAELDLRVTTLKDKTAEGT